MLGNQDQRSQTPAHSNACPFKAVGRAHDGSIFIAMHQFPCPHCGTRLRVADRKTVGTRFACPDCGTLLQLIEDTDSLRAVPAKAPPRTSVAAAPPSTESSAPPRQERLHKKNPLSPALIGWAISLLLMAAMALLIFGLPSTSTMGTQNATGEPNPATAGSDAGPLQEVPVNTPGAATPLSRITELGQRLERFREAQGNWPAPPLAGDLTQEERFGWLATLFAEPHAQPDWATSWRDPRNERFVRRRMDPLLNPLVMEQASPDRFPTTHFVGIAGVGADAPGLPVDHPRAGIFGNARTARREDVKDGLANTMLVAGVAGQLGSWASAGAATVRPFTQEPYVNGPDGFGTGHTREMLVLMADGSVRTISSDTSPVVVRRMAALNDGFTLDHESEGDPLIARPDQPPLEGSVDPVAPMQPDLVTQQPVQPMPPEALFPKLEATLAQRLERFEQPQPATLRTLLAQMEELIGAPIEVSAATAVQLEHAITLDLAAPTIGDILQAMLDKVGLSFEADPSRGIILRVPATATP